MELYYGKGACSLAPHIVLTELGIPHTVKPIQLREGEQKKPEFLSVNPKGSVPALKTEDMGVITEAAVILQYLGDLKPEAKLIPKAGTPERYRLQEWLNYISSEIHKTLGNYFSIPMIPSETTKKEMREMWDARMKVRLDFISQNLQKNGYLAGPEFTVADAYLFTVLSWCAPLGMDLKPWPAILGYLEKIAQRPAVREAQKTEGLL